MDILRWSSRAIVCSVTACSTAFGGSAVLLSHTLPIMRRSFWPMYTLNLKFQSPWSFSSPPNTGGRPSLGSSLRLHGKEFSSSVSFVACCLCRCKKRATGLQVAVHAPPFLTVSQYCLHPQMYRTEPTRCASMSSVTTHRRANRRSATMFDACASVRTTRVFLSERGLMCAP